MWLQMVKDFSFDTIKRFDDHINSSIPRYEDIHACIDGLLEYTVKDNYIIYDLGCSTGNLLSRIDNKFKQSSLNLIGIDKSTNLLPDKVVQNEETNNLIKFQLVDMENDQFLFNNADIVLSVFTLCFIKPKYRQKIINTIYSGLHKHGVFIFVDKVYSDNTRIQDMFTFLYYQIKRNNFTPDQILDKEMSLRGIQYPFTEKENFEMLAASGFKKIESFWRYYNFEGFICIK